MDFLTFTMHMSIGVILVIFQTYLQLRSKFYSVSDLLDNESNNFQQIKDEETSSESKNLLRVNSFISNETYEATLNDLQKKVSEFG